MRLGTTKPCKRAGKLQLVSIVATVGPQISKDICEIYHRWLLCARSGEATHWNQGEISGATANLFVALKITRPADEKFDGWRRARPAVNFCPARKIMV